MNFETIWQIPSPGLPLATDETHVWRAVLNPPDADVQQLRTILSADERTRVDRFRFLEHRRHFTVARGVLRMLLSRYVDIPPEQIQFEYNHYGKPALASNLQDTSLKFNLSHSGEMVVYAFTLNREVGIDIEWTRRRMDDAEQIAKRFFSPREVEVFLGLPEYLKHEAFFNCWTRKEAYIKARGKGLLIPLTQFDVTLAPGEPARLLATRDDPQSATCWTMHALNPGDDYIAALVVEGEGCELLCWQWSEGL